jgi:hypothetical protein
MYGCWGFAGLMGFMLEGVMLWVSLLEFLLLLVLLLVVIFIIAVVALPLTSTYRLLLL